MNYIEFLDKKWDSFFGNEKVTIKKFKRTINKLKDSKNYHTIKHLFMSSRCSIEFLREFTSFNDVRILEAILKNENCPEDIIEDAINAFGLEALEIALGNKNCPIYIFKAILFNKELFIDKYVLNEMKSFENIKKTCSKERIRQFLKFRTKNNTTNELKDYYKKEALKKYSRLLETISNNDSCPKTLVNYFIE